MKKKELKTRIEALLAEREDSHDQFVVLRHRIDTLESQLNALPASLGEALRTQLEQAQSPDTSRLGPLAALEYAAVPRTNLVPRLLSEFPIAPGHDALLVQEGTRLCAWTPGAAQMRLEWADDQKTAAELVRVQWLLVARHGPVEVNVGDPIRGSAFFGDSVIPVGQVYVGGDVMFGARIYLDERAHGRVLTGCQIIVHHAGSSAIGGTGV